MSKYISNKCKIFIIINIVLITILMLTIALSPSNPFTKTIWNKGEVISKSSTHYNVDVRDNNDKTYTVEITDNSIYNRIDIGDTLEIQYDYNILTKHISNITENKSAKYNLIIVN